MNGALFRNEQGGALMLVLALLLAIGLLAALWLTVSAGDLFIAAARRAEHRRRYAAEGAMEHVLALLRKDGAGIVPAGELRGADPAFVSPVAHGVFAGKEYRWQAFFLPDEGNADGNRDTATVLYNQSFGYEGASVRDGGYPVVGVLLELADGAGSTAMRADVTAVVLDPAPEAAWTGGGELLFDGDVHVSGRRHDREGNDRGEGAVPGVVAAGPVHLAGGAFVEGEHGRAVVSAEAGALPGAPEEILGGGEAVARFGDFPPPPGDGSCMDGVFVSAGDYDGPLCGAGVLIVHNPAFDPALYEASRLYLEEGVETAAYDPSYSHLDPARQPARIDLSRGGLFRGLVVSDAFPFVYDRTRIVGAVVTLSRSPSATTAAAPLEVLYSPDALEEASLGPLSQRLGIWSPPEESVLPEEW